jgi:hypothetical protein
MLSSEGRERVGRMVAKAGFIVASIRVEGSFNLARIPISGKKMSWILRATGPHPESTSTSELARRRARSALKRPVNRPMARDDFPGRYGV